MSVISHDALLTCAATPLTWQPAWPSRPAYAALTSSNHVEADPSAFACPQCKHPTPLVDTSCIDAMTHVSC